MYIRRLFGIDLSGRLRSWKSRYNGDIRRFDYTTVWCYISHWNDGTATVTAATYCSDPAVTGMDKRPIARFYSSPALPSATEAELHLRIELDGAPTKFTDTTFYRNVDGQDCVWLNGTWTTANTIPSLERCRGCGLQIQEIICPKCGEPKF
jgi:hypothetical protein